MSGGYGRPAAGRPDGGQSFGKHCIKMRGLPYRATERDISDVSFLCLNEEGLTVILVKLHRAK